MLLKPVGGIEHLAKGSPKPSIFHTTSWSSGRRYTEDQNLDLQRDALRKAGCKKLFEDKESGRAGTKRPALEAAIQ
jgi:hypothetical protein